MSDMNPVRRAARREHVPAHDEGAHLTIPTTGPLRPETGSPLDLLVRRQTMSARPGALLGYVPAQVR